MKQNRGFTLVEVSIVLVIIGLLIGGILVGKNLIRSSEIRSVGSDVEQYKAAVLLFTDQFKAMPGDMKNATQFWGAVAGGTGIGVDATCQAYFDATQTPRTATCNGNGDGQVDSPSNFWSEPWLAWQHLANAKLILGSYTGQGKGAYGTPTNDNPVVGLSSPQSKVNDLTYVLDWFGNITNPAHYAYFIGSYGNVIAIGRATEMNDTVITASEAFELDSKLDDGFPGKGMIRSFKNLYRPECASSDDANTATYVITSNTKGCNLMVKLK